MAASTSIFWPSASCVPSHSGPGTSSWGMATTPSLLGSCSRGLDRARVTVAPPGSTTGSPLSSTFMRPPRRARPIGRRTVAARTARCRRADPRPPAEPRCHWRSAVSLQEPWRTSSARFRTDQGCVVGRARTQAGGGLDELQLRDLRDQPTGASCGAARARPPQSLVVRRRSRAPRRSRRRSFFPSPQRQIFQRVDALTGDDSRRQAGSSNRGG